MKKVCIIIRPAENSGMNIRSIIETMRRLDIPFVKLNSDLEGSGSRRTLHEWVPTRYDHLYALVRYDDLVSIRLAAGDAQVETYRHSDAFPNCWFLVRGMLDQHIREVLAA